MGTFGGHALPGSFFIYFGVWAAFFMLRNFFRRRAYELQIIAEHVPKYHNWISFPAPAFKSGCCKRREVPIDSWLKAVACIVGITGEVITGFNSQWTFAHIGNAQHSTMFAMFGLSGIAELLIFYGLCKFPRSYEYLFGMVAFLTESFLFFFHLHGRTLVDVHIHLLLAGLVWGGFAVGVAEMIFPHQPLAGLVRAWTLLGQGTWFWHVGAILYPPFAWMPVWDENSTTSVVRATNLFTYHLLLNFLFIALLGIAMSFYYLGRMDANTTASRLAVSSKVLETVSPEDDEILDGTEETEIWNRDAHFNTELPNPNPGTLELQL